MINLTKIADLKEMALECDSNKEDDADGGTMKKRSRHSIISQILGICLNGASKTRIVYQANLNFRTVNPYIDILIKNDLIEIRDGTVIYETTEKGATLLDSFKQIHNEIADL